RILERQPQRPLPAHADALHRDRAWTQPPALLEERQHVVEQVTLGRRLRVELAADTVGPPAALSARADAGEAEVVEQAREGGPVAEGLQADAVQMQDAETRPAGRFVDVRRLAADVEGVPGTVHGEPLRPCDSYCMAKPSPRSPPAAAASLRA